MENPTGEPTTQPNEPTETPDPSVDNPTEEPTTQPNEPTGTPEPSVEPPTGEPTTQPNKPTETPDTAVEPPTGEPTTQPIEPTGTPESASDPGVVTLGTVTVMGAGTDVDLVTSDGTGYTYSNGLFTFSSAENTYHMRQDYISTIGVIIYKIVISACDVTLDGHGNTLQGISDGTNGIEIGSGAAERVVVQNFEVSGYFIGISSSGNYATIKDNTVSINGNTGIYSSGSNSNINGNTANGNGGDGIGVTGSFSTINSNTAGSNTYNGLHSSGASTTIRDNTMSSNNQDGIYSSGASATISDNTVRGNKEDGIYSEGDSATISGNTISNSGDTGLYLDPGSSGSIYNNYLANTKNVDGVSLDIGAHTWSQTPAPGTNVMGGPNVAGNYWSNPTGTGWSDSHAANANGYTTDRYEGKTGSGMYDSAPLVRTPPPTPALQGDGSSSPNQYSNTPSTHPSETPQLQIIITSVSLGVGAAPGMTTDLTLTMTNWGSVNLPSQAHIILIPVNDPARSLGELQADYTDGTYMKISSLLIPSDPGVYDYIFNPMVIMNDPITVKDTRVPAGDPVKFTVLVNKNRTVQAQSMTGSSSPGYTPPASSISLGND